MRRPLLLVLAMLVVGACSDTPTDQSAGSQLRIVVTDRSVQVYTDASDLGSCACNALLFPEVGSCSSSTDANPCDNNPYCHSCISDFGVEVDGQRLSPKAGGTDPRAAYFDTIPTGQLSVVLAGCGHPTTRIPLDGPAFLQASANADYANGNAHVSWSTNEAPLSTLVEVDGGFGGQLCHVQGVSDYTFTGWPSALGAGVTPLGSRVDLDTTFGPATVWRAGNATAQFPMTP